MVSKAGSALGFIKRWPTEFGDPYITMTIIISLVSPMLDCVWRPQYEIHVDRIESVQRNFFLF